MKATIFISLLFLIPLSMYTQENYTQEYGKVTQYEMSMTEYPLDKDAEAVVLYDKGEYFFRGDSGRGFLLYMTRQTKIKVLKQAGISYATFEIPYYIEDRQNSELVEGIEAITYNFEDGKLNKVDLNPKNIFEEKVDNKWSIKKVTLSDVRPGSVIEIKYTISTPFFFNMRRWSFQRKIPVVDSKLRYRAIPYYEYTYLMRGATKFDELQTEDSAFDTHFGSLVYKELIYNFGMKNLPAFKDEEFITSEKDYMVALDFQLSKIYYPRGGQKDIITTWPQMCDEFLKDDNFGKYIKDAEKEGKKILPTLALDAEIPLKRTEELAKYVKRMYNWNGDNSKYSSSKLADFLKRKTGNSADINLYLIGLLKAANIDANPVVMSTRGNGIIQSSHPFQQLLDYVLVEVSIDNKKYYIDATEPLLYFTDLPKRCMSVAGLVVKPKSEEWIFIKQKQLSMTQHSLKVNIFPDQNKIEVNAKYGSIGYNAYLYRNIYLGKDDNLVKYLQNSLKIQTVDSINIETNEDLNKPFKFSFKFDLPLEQSSNKLFINPFCNIQEKDNLFKQSGRTLPVDLIYLQGNSYVSSFQIPEGYKIDFLPADISLSDELISILYNAKVDGNTIYVNASYSLNKNVYEANDYLSLKMSFANMINKFSEMIVLVKE
ncbi:MAG: DUF3857 domain-containing protein [Dysgonomonas sp.]